MELTKKQEQTKYVLDTYLSKIVWFMDLSYPKIKPQISNLGNKVEKHYFFEKLKGHEKRFANWFLGMGYDEQIELFKRMSISTSEPVEPIENFFSEDYEKKQRARFFGIVGKNKDKYDYLPIEVAVINQFCLFANNYSGVNFLGLSEKYPNREIYDFNGWAKFYLEITEEDKFIIVNFICAL